MGGGGGGGEGGEIPWTTANDLCLLLPPFLLLQTDCRLHVALVTVSGVALSERTTLNDARTWKGVAWCLESSYSPVIKRKLVTQEGKPRYQSASSRSVCLPHIASKPLLPP